MHVMVIADRRTIAAMPGGGAAHNIAARSLTPSFKGQSNPSARSTSPVTFALKLALGTALCLTPVAAAGLFQAVAQAAPSSYIAPKTAFGQPDIGGYWANSTLTP